MNEKLLLIHKYLVLLIPITLITGSFLPDLFVSISGILLLYIVYQDKQYFLFKHNILYFFYILYFYFILSSILSTDQLLSFSSSLFFFRFIILGISVYFLILNDKKFIEQIYLILSLLISFLILDAMFQYIFDKNILGFSPRANNRITSVFDQESILGSFIIRILPIYVACFFLSLKKYYIIFFFNIICSPIIILLSGERTALILYLLFFIFTLIFTNTKNIYKIIISSLIIFVIFFTLISSQKIIDRIFYFTISEIKNFNSYQHTTMKKSDAENVNEINEDYNKPSIRLSLYQSSIMIFKNNILFGSGPKTFRNECKKYEQDIFITNKYDNKNEVHKIGCSTHPHNTYFQLLAETGFIGFSFLFSFYLYIIYKILNLYFIKFSLNQNSYNFNIFILFSFLINYFPFVPSGNYFNNWLDILYFLPLGFLLIDIKKNV